MAKFLNIEPGNINYRLPAETDMEAMKQAAEETLANGSAMAVTVEMNDDPTNNAVVVLNGDAVVAIRLGEAGV
jgi:hypothetical protein